MIHHFVRRQTVRERSGTGLRRISCFNIAFGTRIIVPSSLTFKYVTPKHPTEFMAFNRLPRRSTVPADYGASINTAEQSHLSPNAAEARAMVRDLVEVVHLIPEEGRLRIEVRGELASILGLAGGVHNKSPGGGAEALQLQMKMVAGTCLGRDRHLLAVAI